MVEWGSFFPRHVALGNRALFHAEERFAGFAVQQEEVAGLRADCDGGSLADVKEQGLRGYVVVPQVMVNGLEMPNHVLRATTE
jgi:hypothetical protein